MKKIFCFVLLIALLNFITGCKVPPGSSPVVATPYKTPVTETPVFTATNTPTNTPVIEKEILFDDMEDGDIVNNFGGYWYSYNDNNVEGGNSYVVPLPEEIFYMQRPGANGSLYCAKITGEVKDGFFYGFIGMGSNFGDYGATINMNKYKSIKFWCKGEQKQFKVILSSSHPGFLQGENDNHYSFRFTPGNDWTEFEIPLQSFTQELYWGSIVEKEDALSQVKAIRFENAYNLYGYYELSVDDIKFVE